MEKPSSEKVTHWPDGPWMCRGSCCHGQDLNRTVCSCPHVCVPVVPKHRSWEFTPKAFFLCRASLQVNSWVSSLTLNILSFVALRTSRPGKQIPLLKFLCPVHPSMPWKYPGWGVEVWPSLFQVSFCHFGGSFLEMTFVKYECPGDIQIYISRLLYPLGFVLWWLFSKGHVSSVDLLRWHFSFLSRFWNWTLIDNLFFEVKYRFRMHCFLST